MRKHTHQQESVITLEYLLSIFFWTCEQAAILYIWYSVLFLVTLSIFLSIHMFCCLYLLTLSMRWTQEQSLLAPVHMLHPCSLQPSHFSTLPLSQIVNIFLPLSKGSSSHNHSIYLTLIILLTILFSPILSQGVHRRLEGIVECVENIWCEVES